MFPLGILVVIGAALLSVVAAGSARAGEEDAPDPAAGAAAQDAPGVDFARDIQPIFAARCYSCHGPEKHESGLRLDRAADGKKGGDRGKMLAPGSSKESLLIQFVTGENDDEIVMPPEGKPLSEAQIALLCTWIDRGAAWPETADALAAAAGARRHWAFQLVRRPKLPAVKNTAWIRNPIDAFVLARLEQAGIEPSPEADRATLVRRLFLDLLGLPPSPAELHEFVNDARPDAYERLVDRLLASPHFGERWGRHWLDLARYADSDGYEDDKYRPDAWRYRDWVVEAVNSDMPFDRFTIEQLAGDLLPGDLLAGDPQSGAGYEQLLATGFHRMTLSNDSGGGGIAEEFRVKAVKDRANTTGTVWLGLTVGCAQCHSHKYDPFTLRDYYSLYAFFNNAEEAAIDAPALPRRYWDAYDRVQSAYELRICAAQLALADYEENVLPGRQAEWERSVDPKSLPRDLREVVAMPQQQRSDEQRERLTDWFETVDEQYLALKKAVPDSEEIKNNRPLPPSSHALVLRESSAPRTTHIQKAGDFQSPGEAVSPGVPEFLPPLVCEGPQPTRLDLARWIVSPVNPLTGRVAVNYTWQHLFGRGLVSTPEDFGRHGRPPSHPELLDWLASRFVEGGWRRKPLIRLIVTSAAYRQSSNYRPELAGLDPENELLSRQRRFRVEAEVVRDLALAASGLLEPRIGGPSVQPPLPAGLMQLDTLKTERFMETSPGADRYRRGVYTNVQRTLVNPMLQTFDVGDPNGVCTRRDRSNTPLQALTLLNDPVFVECAQALGRRVLAECPHGDRRQRIRCTLRLCLSREADDEELSDLESLVAEQDRILSREPRLAASIIGDAPLPGGADAAETAVWVGLARTLLNLDEFITRE